MRRKDFSVTELNTPLLHIPKSHIRFVQHTSDVHLELHVALFEFRFEGFIDVDCSRKIIQEMVLYLIVNCKLQE